MSLAAEAARDDVVFVVNEVVTHPAGPACLVPTKEKERRDESGALVVQAKTNTCVLS